MSGEVQPEKRLCEWDLMVMFMVILWWFSGDLVWIYGDVMAWESKTCICLYIIFYYFCNTGDVTRRSAKLCLLPSDQNVGSHWKQQGCNGNPSLFWVADSMIGCNSHTMLNLDEHSPLELLGQIVHSLLVKSHHWCHCFMFHHSNS